MNEFDHGPFVYDKHLTLINDSVPGNTEIKNEHLCSIELEERGEKGSCIFTTSNLFTDDQCEVMIDYILKHDALLEEKVVCSKSYNNVKCKYITLDNMVRLNIPDSKELDNFIFKSIGKILTKLRDSTPSFTGTQDTGYTLRKIYGGTAMHIDGIHSESTGYTKSVRCLSIIIVLNDDYDGGVFCFPYQGLKFRVQKGQAVLFPPYWTHPHSVTSVGEGQARYTINTWVLEKFVD
jgi:hypothetical protein